MGYCYFDNFAVIPRVGPADSPPTADAGPLRAADEAPRAADGARARPRGPRAQPTCPCAWPMGPRGHPVDEARAPTGRTCGTSSVGCPSFSERSGKTFVKYIFTEHWKLVETLSSHCNGFHGVAIQTP